MLDHEALHGTTRDFVSVFLAQLVDVAKSALTKIETNCNVFTHHTFIVK